jgi:hypothetical protein
VLHHLDRFLVVRNCLEPEAYLQNFPKSILQIDCYFRVYFFILFGELHHNEEEIDTEIFTIPSDSAITLIVSEGTTDISSILSSIVDSDQVENRITKLIRTFSRTL